MKKGKPCVDDDNETPEHLQEVCIRLIVYCYLLVIVQYEYSCWTNVTENKRESKTRYYYLFLSANSIFTETACHLKRFDESILITDFRSRSIHLSLFPLYAACKTHHSLPLASSSTLQFLLKIGCLCFLAWLPTWPTSEWGSFFNARFCVRNDH